ncbi:MAG: hypothetical protein QXW73_10210, partial [Nitrososphaerales archaeon]
MHCRYGGNNRIRYLTTLSVLILLLSNPLFYDIRDINAQQVQLIVSAAQDPGQNNIFFGPQIVQI